MRSYKMRRNMGLRTNEVCIELGPVCDISERFFEFSSYLLIFFLSSKKIEGVIYKIEGPVFRCDYASHKRSCPSVRP